jgi:FkbM family methyltransferase
VKLSEAVVRKLDQEGAAGLLASVPEFLWSRVRLAYFSARKVVLDDTVVTLGGVAVDVSSAVFTPELEGVLLKGRYERAERRLLKRHLPEECDVVELGAGVGVVSATIDRNRTGGTHVAVEANESVLPALERTRSLNDATFEVVHAAYSSRDSVQLSVDDVFWSGRAVREGSPDGTTTVRGTTLEELCEEYGLDEFVLVADIEGSEHELVETESELLGSRCSLIVVELHGTEAKQLRTRERLETTGFEMIDSTPDEDVYVYRRRRPHPPE